MFQGQSIQLSTVCNDLALFNAGMGGGHLHYTIGENWVHGVTLFKLYITNVLSYMHESYHFYSENITSKTMYYISVWMHKFVVSNRCLLIENNFVGRDNMPYVYL